MNQISCNSVEKIKGDYNLAIVNQVPIQGEIFFYSVLEEIRVIIRLNGRYCCPYCLLPIEKSSRCAKLI